MTNELRNGTYETLLLEITELGGGGLAACIYAPRTDQPSTLTNAEAAAQTGGQAIVDRVVDRELRSVAVEYVEDGLTKSGEGLDGAISEWFVVQSDRVQGVDLRISRVDGGYQIRAAPEKQPASTVVVMDEALGVEPHPEVAD